MSYTNPVYPDYFADPFVLKHGRGYYAYGTAPASPEGDQFPVLYSEDLVHWERRGWALRPSEVTGFWAPEVAYHDGRFYLYYSCGEPDGTHHQLRVAVSDDPLGYFDIIDEILVPDQPFSIDAHPFQDRDGQWYLYYARDFLTLDGEYRVGTGIVVDRLMDMTRLEGHPQIVVRPHMDWHLFKAQRTMYNAIYDWHTVEGPSTLLHNDRYYCFYSGGAWEEANYGVAYVVADHPLGPYHPPEPNEPILKSISNRLFGPGHNSFTTGPNSEDTFMVYHAWDTNKTMRRMCIDRLIWQGDRPTVKGPTWTEQPLP
jgi:arabinan endo-1,5-alpha-L-arabinosidase